MKYKYRLKYSSIGFLSREIVNPFSQIPIIGYMSKQQEGNEVFEQFMSSKEKRICNILLATFFVSLMSTWLIFRCPRFFFPLKDYWMLLQLGQYFS